MGRAYVIVVRPLPVVSIVCKLWSVGFALNWDEIVYEGSPEDAKFAAFFVK